MLRWASLGAAVAGAAMPEMLSDVHHWIAHGTYPSDEIAVRLHHRLVSIHPFANGNGRHRRGR